MRKFGADVRVCERRFLSGPCTYLNSNVGIFQWDLLFQGGVLKA